MKTAIGKATGSRRAEALPRIYCAGPLFNRAEQAEMAEIATAVARLARPAASPRAVRADVLPGGQP